MERRALQTPSRFPCSNLTFPFTQYTKKSFPDVLCQAKISILLYIPHGCAKSAFYLRPVSKQETRTRKIFSWYDFAIASRSHPQFHKREDEWQRNAWLHFFFLFPFCLLFLLLQLSFQFLNYLIWRLNTPTYSKILREHLSRGDIFPEMNSPRGKVEAEWADILLLVCVRTGNVEHLGARASCGTASFISGLGLDLWKRWAWMNLSWCSLPPLSVKETNIYISSQMLSVGARSYES